LKQLINERWFAVLLLINAIIFSMFIGTNTSAGRNIRKLDKLYTGGMLSEDGQYTQASLKSQTDASMDYAMGLLTIANNYTDDGEIALWAGRLKQQREGYLRVCDLDKRGSPRKADSAQYYHTVVDAAENLYAAMGSAELSASDAADAKAFYNDLTGAKTLIASLAGQYNAEVAVIKRNAEDFPAYVFCNTSNVTKLQNVGFPAVTEIIWNEDGSWSASMEEI